MSVPPLMSDANATLEVNDATLSSIPHDFLCKLIADKSRPTVAWAVLTGEDLSAHHLNCLRQLPSSENDKPKTFRIRCLTCYKTSLPAQSLDVVGRVAKLTQPSDFASHCGSQTHFQCHVESNPISSNEMRSRIRNACPLLRATLAEYAAWLLSTEKKGKKRAPTYTNRDLDNVEREVEDIDVNALGAKTKLLALYSHVFDLGMGSKASTRGAGVSRKPKANPCYHFRLAHAQTEAPNIPPRQPPDPTVTTTEPPTTRQAAPRHQDFIHQLEQRSKSTSHFFTKRNTSA